MPRSISWDLVLCRYALCFATVCEVALRMPPWVALSLAILRCCSALPSRLCYVVSWCVTFRCLECFVESSFCVQSHTALCIILPPLQSVSSCHVMLYSYTLFRFTPCSVRLFHVVLLRPFTSCSLKRAALGSTHHPALLFHMPLSLLHLCHTLFFCLVVRFVIRCYSRESLCVFFYVRRPHEVPGS